MSVLTGLHSAVLLSIRRSTRPGAPGSDVVAKDTTGGPGAGVVGHTPPRPAYPRITWRNMPVGIRAISLTR